MDDDGFAPNSAALSPAPVLSRTDDVDVVIEALGVS